MTEKPLVSIITVVRNAALSLDKTIQSVIKQSYEHIEYIIVDGLSTDNTVQIIKQYDKNITRWISEKDKNLYDAMNKGLALAKGDLVWFLHAGDVIPNDNTLQNALQNYQPHYDLVYGEALVLKSDNTFINWHKKVPQQLVWQDFKQGMVVCHQAMLIKRSVAKEYDLRWVLAGDIDWCLRSMKGVKFSLYVSDILCYFQTGGLSSTKKKESLIERFNILRHHFGLLEALYIHLKLFFKML